MSVVGPPQSPLPAMTHTTMEALASANALLGVHTAVVARVKSAQLTCRRRLGALPSPPLSLLNFSLIPARELSSPSPSPPPSPGIVARPRPQHAELPPAKRARAARYVNYVPEEETIRNDYSQRYVDGGEWPQNWVLGAEPERRFEEYPKQARLLALKKAAVATHAPPPTYLPLSALSFLHPCKFDCILIDPPFSSSYTWDTLQNDIPVPTLAADPSFVFLWVGSGAGDGLERGREVLAKWGYRRCEDVVWVRTNAQTNKGPGTDAPTTSLLTRTAHHCLIGIRGTVRRSTDAWFVHCNVDTDVLVHPGYPCDPARKPDEIYSLVENFCLGARRLEIYGRGGRTRKGWVTVFAEGEEKHVGEITDMEGCDQELPRSWDRQSWETSIRTIAEASGDASKGRFVVPMTPEIEALRPKSPTRSAPLPLPGTPAAGNGRGPVGNGGAVSGGVGLGVSGGVGLGIGRGQNQLTMHGMPMGRMPMAGMAMAGMPMGMQNVGMGLDMGVPNIGMMGGMGTMAMNIAPGIGGVSPGMMDLSMNDGFHVGFNNNMGMNMNMNPSIMNQMGLGMGWDQYSEGVMWDESAMPLGMMPGNMMGAMGMGGMSGMGQWQGGPNTGGL